MSYNFYNPLQGNNNNTYLQQQQMLQQQMLQQQVQPQIQPQIQQQAPQGFTITPVGGLEEVKAKSVDWTGKPEYFIDNANGKVYSKFLDLSGVPKVNVYSLETAPAINVEYATKEEVNKLKSIIDSFLEGLKGGVKNE